MARMDCNMEKLHYYQSLSLLNPSRGTRLGEKEGTPPKKYSLLHHIRWTKKKERLLVQL